MPTEGWTHGIVQSERLRQNADHGFLTALREADETTDYDKHAALYDHVIGNRLYNRLVWGIWPRAYTEFAARALASTDGPLLDVGCGSAVFTADAYRASSRPQMLVDRSAGMLARAKARVGKTPGARAQFVHADLFDLPFHPHNFTTVTCHGMLHLFTDTPGVLRVLCAQLAPGGTLYVSSLVAETPVGSRVLHALHRKGDIARPRTADTVLAQARTVLGDDISTSRRGGLLFLTADADRTM